MNPTDEFISKFLNLWFYKEPPTDEISNSMKSFANDAIRLLLYGDDAIFAHPKIKEIIFLCKDYGIIEYEKSLMEIYYEGKIKVQIEMREAFNSPEVSMQLQAIMNVVGTLVNKFKEAAQKQIEKEKNAIPELKHRKCFEN